MAKLDGKSLSQSHTRTLGGLLGASWGLPGGLLGFPARSLPASKGVKHKAGSCCVFTPTTTPK
jgi:hypothetical protein